MSPLKMVTGTLFTTVVKDTILEKIKNQLHPTHIEVVNESYKHKGPPNAESHFHVVVVSNHWEQVSRIGRSRQIHEILREELAGPVHALSLRLYTENEWNERQNEAAPSPQCRGGDGRHQ